MSVVGWMKTKVGYEQKFQSNTLNTRATASPFELRSFTSQYVDSLMLKDVK